MNIRYQLFQIPFPEDIENDSDYKKYAFECLSNVDSVDIKRYAKVYEGEIAPRRNTLATLESIYIALNLHHPADYNTRSVSVSDIVLIDGKYYYCDSFGWEPINPQL